jgi:putative salt-induced outer membrane protein YdiY
MTAIMTQWAVGFVYLSIVLAAGAEAEALDSAPSATLRFEADASDQQVSIGPSTLAMAISKDELANLHMWASRSFFAQDQPEVVDEVDPDAPPTYPWEISFELGGSGSRGNTDEDNFHTSIRVHHETPKTATDLGVDYRFSQQNGTETKNQTYLFGRREWPLADTPLNLFLGSSLEFDEFKEFDERWAVNAGFGFRAIATEKEKLQLNVGSGFSKEFGSVDDNYKPEALLGLLYRNKLNAHVVLTGSAQYFPNIEDWIDDYRLRGEVALEVALTEGKDWWLKLSAEDHYDNTPTGTDEANDFYYGVSLLFKF